MPRPKSIDDEEILEAAREVFLEHGIQATTAQVAERADISEGTIYQRFGSKEALFLAAMDISNPPDWQEMLDAFDGSRSLEEDLHDLALEMIDFFEEIIPKIHMVMSSPVHADTFFDGGGDPPPVQGVRELTRFFHEERKRGRLGACDPEIVARMFLGSVYHFAFFNVSDLDAYMPMPRETFVRGMVANLLGSLSSEDGSSPEDE
jgi:AcrR family transcriptional regulator